MKRQKQTVKNDKAAKKRAEDIIAEALRKIKEESENE